MTTDQKLKRLLAIWQTLRQREDEAAKRNEYLLACLYNRAALRASLLMISIHFNDPGRHRYTAINLNEYYAKQAPWTPDTLPLDQLLVEKIGGSNALSNN